MIGLISKYIFLAAMRDRFILSLAGGLLLVAALSAFFASSVIVEQDQFVRVFTAYGLRLFGVAVIVLFTVSYIRRSFESRDIDYLLSRPLSRVQFVLAHAAAFSILAVTCAIAFGVAAIVMGRHDFNAGALLWLFSLCVEFIIMANLAMFFALVVSSATACIAAVFSFYLLARLMGEILGILKSGADTFVEIILARTMEVVSVFIPRLDLMAQSGWLLYGDREMLSPVFIAGQGAVFVFLIIAAAVFDMKRRQF